MAPDGTNLISPNVLYRRYYFQSFVPNDSPSKTPYAVFTVEADGVEQFGGGAFALQDAGCEDAAVLDHCRGPGPHVRGCWVVDGVLGKG